MRLASLIISLCLHSGVFLLFWFWPAGQPVRMDSPPIMISLVEGAPGGDRMPSPIMGHMGEEGEGPLALTPPAPQSEIAAHARAEIKAPDLKPAPLVEARPVAPEPKPDPIPVKATETPGTPAVTEPPRPAPPKPEPKKTEPPKQAPKKETPKPVPKKEQPKPAPKKQQKPDPVAEALRQARRQASSRASGNNRGNAVEHALAQAQRQAGGTKGGGGGSGEGPGGGGLGDVYMGQVMLAVRPNWGFASGGRKSLSCVVKVKVDMAGTVQLAEISRSSGNPQYDASAVNAVIRTSQAHEFPPPPNQDYTDLDLVFTLDELMGR